MRSSTPSRDGARRRPRALESADGTPEQRSDERLRALIEAGVALSGTLELDAVLRRIVRIATRVVRARYGALGVLSEDGTALESFLFHGISKAEADRIGRLPQGVGILGLLIRDARPLRLDDLTTDPASVGFPPNHPPMRTFLGVPVVARGQVFGNLYLTEKRGGVPFTDSDEEIVRQLAVQAGVAVENARLYADARARERDAARRVRELTSLQEVGRALLAELDQTRVLRMIAERARGLAAAHSAAIAFRVSDELVLDVVVGVGAREARGMRAPMAKSVAELTLTSRQARKIDDLDADGRLHAPIAEALRARSAMIAPLFDRDEALGVLAVTHRRPGRFTDDDLTLLQAFADLASLALRNARLFIEERERVRAQGELRAAELRAQMKADLLRQVIRAQEDERARISRDLHDSTGQALASILLGLKVAEQQSTLAESRARIADLRRMTSDAVSEMRSLALELRPTVLDDLGLPAALERYVRDFEVRTQARTVLRIDHDAGRLEPEIETVVYRVAQEALTNIVKHAQATTVRVDLTRRNGVVRLRVRDDGIGFDLGAIGDRGLGLAGMHERVGLVGGTLAIRSAPTLGTAVELQVSA